MRRFLLCFLSLAALLVSAAPVALAQPAAGLVLQPVSGGVAVYWQLTNSREPQRFLLYFATDAPAAPVIRALRDQPLAEPLSLPTLPEMEIDGELRPPLPAFMPDPPTAPLRLLGEGYQRGVRSALYEIAPRYLAGDEPRLALSFTAFIAGASLAPVASASSPQLASVSTPDPLAARVAWTIDVAAEGIQQISAETLRALGLDLNAISPDRLRLQRAGMLFPLEVITSGATVTAIRFYAPPPGDRWSATDRYWLTVESTVASLMGTRTAQPQTGDQPAIIRVAGVWLPESPIIYESTLAGFDGDRFFSRQLNAVAGSPVSTTLALSSLLPFAASGAMSVTLELATLAKHNGNHRVQLATPSGWNTTITWSGAGMYRATVTLPAPTSALTLTLDPVAGIDRVYLDRVFFDAPAQATFSAQGAIFRGQAGRFSYSLPGVAAGVAVYDVTDPQQPVRLLFSGTAFADDAPAPRRYLVTGTATLHTPVVARHQPVDFTTPRSARAVYIAPRALLAALDPLLNHRQAQGWSPVALAVEDIFAGWSGGEPDPNAIRRFLRYAVATWPTKPEAVILVGDGSSDPRNYLGYGWPSLIPPYLAEVDPWLGETACETCFAQLDGDDPLAESLFQPEVWIGRLPVKTETELRNLVAKLLAYEQSRGIWQRHAVYLADNPDTAGDFAALLDEAIARQPAQTTATRVYYDPAGPAGRIADAVAAREQAFAAFNQGAGLLVYAGHGLQFQWAFTQVGIVDPFLLNVDTATDLRNAPAWPVVLSMTCLTGAFQHPSFRGTTIDEALVLNPAGGAVATWSSSGFGVANGHRQLLLGFVEALWAGSPHPPLGQLVAAGYAALMASSAPRESLYTFLLLGDPLTPVTARPLYRVDVPVVQR
ncbi:C25 family cysteine peptidase [Chloroflexus sp.]|uniref:C25 family cysteine peptidase n=1 Tax=Chloroflexus sp. TaxID=1904827 RepID=UPI00298F1622|nr:C25 family cysteine peptidase [Chloroflexus sp.]MDW8403379.1 C25 family cysteine peptidase [Chloroflexus sp.]